MLLEQRPDSTIRLSGSDATFVLDEPIEPQHTLKIAVFDEQSSKAFRFERVSEELNAAVAILPQMRWAVQLVPLGLGHPVWFTDSAFDVRNHLRHAVLPGPGTKSSCVRASALVASEPVPAGRPPWELWFFEGFEGNMVVAVLKMNHALADGGTFAELLDLITHPDPNSPPIVPAIPRAAARMTRRAALWDGTRDLWQGFDVSCPGGQGLCCAHTRAGRRRSRQGRPRGSGLPRYPGAARSRRRDLSRGFRYRSTRSSKSRGTFPEP